MSDKPYYPNKPPMNWTSEQCPTPHPNPYDCGCDSAVPPPTYGCMPEHGPCPGWEPIHPLKPVKPVRPPLEGYSYYEALDTLTGRVNECINQWNRISDNCFMAMQNCVNAARANEVYYSDHEVRYQEGYDTNDGCAYAIIEKKAVDKHGKPILMKLAPAYDNSTNSGVGQDIFDVSFIKSANVIVTAVPCQQDKWYGPAMWKGMQIPGYNPNDDLQEGEEETKYFLYGFNRQGVLRYFTQDVTAATLCQNGMVDVIGGCIPIINDGAILESAESLTTKSSIQAIGFNSGTGSVFIFACSANDQPGMQGINVAKLLQGYGCTTAVISNIVDGQNQNFTGGLMYMGQMATVPQGGKVPNNLAYWVINKCENFNNGFQKEIADLVQTTGNIAWKNYLTGVQIKGFDDRITQNAKDIADEIERATKAEELLQNNINAETNRAMAAERVLQENIDNEINRATASETELNQKIEDETTRATQRENEIADELSAEKIRAQTRENEIQNALDKEIRERIAADNDIINAIEQEVLARRAADTALENKIDAINKQLKQDIQGVQDIVNGITGGQTKLPYLPLTGGTMTGNITMDTGNTIILGRGPTTDNEAATKKYVDDAVAAGGGGGGGGDVSKDYVDTQITNLQTQLNDKVARTGDTMIGPLNMDGQKIENAVLSSNTGVSMDNGAGGPGKLTNLADPVNPTDAVNLQTLESKIEEGDYVPIAGGSMTGDLNMTDNSVINFTDPSSVSAALDKKATTATSSSINMRPSKIAKQLGITAELLAMAQDKGLNVNEATVGTVMNTLNINPYAVTGQDIKGSVYNDSEDMVVKSESGKILLKGTEINVSNGSGDNVEVLGVSAIGPTATEGMQFKPTETDVYGPLYVVNAAGEPSGTIKTGKVQIGGTVLEPHENSSGVEHIDIDVPSSAGSVYINRSENGSPVDGGTGELWVTEVHAPNELLLRPGTSVNVGGSPIKNVRSLRPVSNNGRINISSSTTSDDNDGRLILGELIADKLIIVNPSSGLGFNVTNPSTSAENSPALHFASNNNDNGLRLENILDGVNDSDAATVRQLNRAGGINSDLGLITNGGVLIYHASHPTDLLWKYGHTLNFTSTQPSYIASINILNCFNTTDTNITFTFTSSNFIGTVLIYDYKGYIRVNITSGTTGSLTVKAPNGMLYNSLKHVNENGKMSAISTKQTVLDISTGKNFIIATGDPIGIYYPFIYNDPS